MGNELETLGSHAKDAIIADALASEAGPPVVRSRGQSVALTHCGNCGTPLTGAFCSHCGQKADTFQRPIWALFGEAVEGLFSLDGRFWRTIPALIFRPGRVTARYLSGQRQRYMLPFRLFLFASVLFFLTVLSFGNIRDMFTDDLDNGVQQLRELEAELAKDPEADPERLETIRRALAALGQDQTTDEGAAGAELDSDLVPADISAALIEAREEKAAREARGALLRECSIRQSLLPQSVPAGCPENTDGDGFTMTLWPGWDAFLSEGAKAFVVNKIVAASNDPFGYLDSVQNWLPRIIFILFPLYALLLGLMHVWHRRLYLFDHLVVSLHFHAFIFLFTPLLILGGMVWGSLISSLVFVVWSNYWLYRAHREVYGHGRLSSVFRVIVLDIIYLVILVLALILLMTLSVVSV